MNSQPILRLSLLLTALMICLLAQTSTGVAQRRSVKTGPAKVILRNIGMAKVSVSRGSLRRTIDLAAEVVGCQYVPRARGSEFRKRGCAASPATFRLLDATMHDGNAYLIVLSEAMDNCNVCGMCGATEAFALIWLELDPSLRPRNKRSVALEDCRDSVSLISAANTVADAEPENEKLMLPFTGDRLIVEFEKTIFSEDHDRQTYQFSHLEYNRKEPARGFVVTTETRAKATPANQ